MRSGWRIAAISLTATVLSLGNVTAEEETKLAGPSGDPSIVSPDAKIETLFDGAMFTEGPAVAPDGSVYFSDITFSHQS